MIRDIGLSNLHEELSYLLKKLPREDQHSAYTAALISTCRTIAGTIDRLQERESLHVQELHKELNSLTELLYHEIRSIRADLAAVQALTTR